MTVHAPSTSPAAARAYFSFPHTFKATYAAAHIPIKEAKYKSISPNEVAKQCTYLSSVNQSKLNTLLSQFPTLFSGKLGRYNKTRFTLELQDPNISPIFCKPYPIAQTHMAVFKQELSHLIDKGVLQHISLSKWASLTFIVPKKDDRVRWISDFRKLNVLLKRPRYFLPSIPEVM